MLFAFVPACYEGPLYLYKSNEGEAEVGEEERRRQYCEKFENVTFDLTAHWMPLSMTTVWSLKATMVVYMLGKEGMNRRVKADSS